MSNKRFWVLDELIKIGHLEAAMSHADEMICNLDQDLENSTELEDVEKIAKEQDYARQAIRLDYENRVLCEDSIMDETNGNKKDWCLLKHHATAFVIAAENYHARGCRSEAERSLILSAKALALTASHCFGFEIMDCLRCVGDALNAKYHTESNPVQVLVAVAKKDEPAEKEENQEPVTPVEAKDKKTNQ